MQGSNPHKQPSSSPFALAVSLSDNWQLICQMTRREVVGRYKGSALGLTWSFFNPVLMLAVYTFVFSEIFGLRWGENTDSHNKAQFAFILFAGLIVLALFSEVLNAAPKVVLSNANYVKKVVFPLEVLPVIQMGSAIFHALASTAVLLAASAIVTGNLPWTALFLPLIFLPLIMLTMGLAWILASLGVYLRDVGQGIGMATTVLMFLSPVFYPLEAVPERFRPYILANPLTFIIEQTRAVLIWGNTPDWVHLGLYSLVALAFMWLGFVWFQKTRQGFADVL
jgi:lipopolysaccharide transport system permease protein